MEETLVKLGMEDLIGTFQGNYDIFFDKCRNIMLQAGYVLSELGSNL